jgi:peptide/histidine transporter 3/4
MSKVSEAKIKTDSISMDQSKVSEANNGGVDHSMVETRVVGGNTYEVIEGKVDWRGRPALRGRHGGVGNSFFILGNSYS